MNVITISLLIILLNFCGVKAMDTSQDYTPQPGPKTRSALLMPYLTVHNKRKKMATNNDSSSEQEKTKRRRQELPDLINAFKSISFQDKKHHAIVRQLLGHKPNEDQMTDEEPVIKSASSNQTTIISLLINAGAGLRAKNKSTLEKKRKETHSPQIKLDSGKKRRQT